MTEILNASVNGQFYSGLSDEAKLLLTQHGFRDLGDSGVLTKTERNALAKIQSSTDARLTAIADATEYVHEMAVALGKLQVQRDQIAAVLKQLESGAMRRPQAEKMFGDLGRSLGRFSGRCGTCLKLSVTTWKRLIRRCWRVVACSGWLILICFVRRRTS